MGINGTIVDGDSGIGHAQAFSRNLCLWDKIADNKRYRRDPRLFRHDACPHSCGGACPSATIPGDEGIAALFPECVREGFYGFFYFYYPEIRELTVRDKLSIGVAFLQ